MYISESVVARVKCDYPESIFPVGQVLRNKTEQNNEREITVILSIISEPDDLLWIWKRSD